MFIVLLEVRVLTLIRNGVEDRIMVIMCPFMILGLHRVKPSIHQFFFLVYIAGTEKGRILATTGLMSTLNKHDRTSEESYWTGWREGGVSITLLRTRSV